MSKQKSGSADFEGAKRDFGAAGANSAADEVPQVLTADSKWRVSKDELGDPLIELVRGRGLVYAIGPKTLGLWLCGKPGLWVRKLRLRFGASDVRQRGDTEVVFAWPADHPRTDELLAFIGSRRRRQLSDDQRARLIEAGSSHRYRAGHRPKTPSAHGAQRRTSRARSGKRTKVGSESALVRNTP